MGKIGYGKGGVETEGKCWRGVVLGETTRIFAGIVRAGWLVRDGGSIVWCVAYGICWSHASGKSCPGGLSRWVSWGCHQPLIRPRVALGFAIVPDDQLCGGIHGHGHTQRPVLYSYWGNLECPGHWFWGIFQFRCIPGAFRIKRGRV